MRSKLLVWMLVLLALGSFVSAGITELNGFEHGYKLDNVNDVNSSINLIAVNSPTFSTGKVGDALNLGNPNTNKYAWTGSGNGIYTSAEFQSTWSMSFWYKSDDDTQVDKKILQGVNGNPGQSWLIGTHLGSSVSGLIFSMYDGSSTSIIPGIPSDTDWHNVVLTYDGVNTIKMYVDGKFVGSETFTISEVGRTTSKTTFGAEYYTSSSGYFTGLVDSAYFWNIKLDDDSCSVINTTCGGDIEILYNNGDGNENPFSVENIDLNIISPLNGSKYSLLNYTDVNVSINGSVDPDGLVNCSFFHNGVFDTYSTNINLTNGWSWIVDLVDGNNNLSVNCTASESLNDSVDVIVFADIIEPNVTINKPVEGDSFIEELVTFNGSCADDNLLYYNMTVLDAGNNLVYNFYEENISVSFFDHESSNYTSDFVAGIASLNITCADSHTTYELKKLKSPSRKDSKTLNFDYTEVSLVDNGVSLYTVKEKDRYSFIYDSPTKINSLTWRLSGNWEEVKGSDYCGHIVNVENDLWFDAEDENADSCSVKIRDGYALVTAYFKKSVNSGWTKSLGELNVGSREITFSVRDNQAPVTTLISPLNDSFYNDVVVDFEFNITDDYNDSVNYTLYVMENGSSFVDCLSGVDVDTTGGYSYNDNSSCSFVDGSIYTWYINATDGINYSESLTFNFTYNFTGASVDDLIILPSPILEDVNLNCNYTFINSTGGSGNDFSNISWYVNSILKENFRALDYIFNITNSSDSAELGGSSCFYPAFPANLGRDGNFSTYALANVNFCADYRDNYTLEYIPYDVNLYTKGSGQDNYCLNWSDLSWTYLGTNDLFDNENLSVYNIPENCINVTEVRTRVSMFSSGDRKYYESGLFYNNDPKLNSSYVSDGDAVRCDVLPYDGMSVGSVQSYSTFADFTDPSLLSGFLNYSIFINNNVDGVFNISDNVLLNDVNVSVDGVSVDSYSGVGVAEFLYNLSLSYSSYGVGLHNLSFEFSDLYGQRFTVNNFSFVVGNFSKSFDDFLVAGFVYDFGLDVDFGLLPINLSLYSPVAVLDWNGTNYTADLDLFSNVSANFSYSLSVPLLDGSELINHLWHFRLDNLTGGYLNSSVDSQNVTGLQIGVCNSTLVYPILNLTYYDEVSGEAINVSNGYSLNITDGTYFYPLSGSFSGDSHALCTNLDPVNVSFNWEATGSFSLNSSGYISRIFSYVEGSELDLSNDPVNNVSLYLIAINDSTTVTYFWKTTEFQIIDGLMLIYRCNLDGSRSLVESTPIVGGEAVGNIELLTATYSYEVVIGGVVYTSDSFTVCHVESQTERSFFVDVNAVDVIPVVGLFLVDCSLTNISDNGVLMEWGSNPGDPNVLEACIVAKRQGIYNYSEFFRNCTNASSGSLISYIPQDGNRYTVTGELTQNGVKGYCQDSISYFEGTDTTDLFGLTGVLSVALLLVALVLAYAPKGEDQPIAIGIALLGAWVLGLLAFPWEIISSIVGFLLMVILVGRYSKKQRVE